MADHRATPSNLRRFAVANNRMYVTPEDVHAALEEGVRHYDLLLELAYILGGMSDVGLEDRNTAMFVVWDASPGGDVQSFPEGSLWHPELSDGYCYRVFETSSYGAMGFHMLVETSASLRKLKPGQCRILRLSGAGPDAHEHTKPFGVEGGVEVKISLDSDMVFRAAVRTQGEIA